MFCDTWCSETPYLGLKRCIGFAQTCRSRPEAIFHVRHVWRSWFSIPWRLSTFQAARQVQFSLFEFIITIFTTLPYPSSIISHHCSDGHAGIEGAEQTAILFKQICNARKGRARKSTIYRRLRKEPRVRPLGTKIAGFEAETPSSIGSTSRFISCKRLDPSIMAEPQQDHREFPL